MTLICMRMKLHAEHIFIWKVSHIDSFWNRGTRELGNGLFHFRCGTKPRDQKQETGNDSDVISGLQASRKTDFPVIFLLWANQFAKKWYNSALLIRNVGEICFSRGLESWNDVTSFPVSYFWSRGFVPHRKWNLTLLVHQNTGKENCYRKISFAILISTLGRFHRANKKICLIHFKKTIRANSQIYLFPVGTFLFLLQN